MTQATQSSYQRLRKRAGVTQAAVAEELGVDTATLSRFENYGAPLSRGLTEDDYLAALERLGSTGVAR